MGKANLALLATLKSKPGKGAELAAFLKSALPLAEQEEATSSWFALKVDDSTYAIFDTFSDEAGRDAHLNGDIASALMARAGELLSTDPDIKKVEVLAAKLPG